LNIKHAKKKLIEYMLISFNKNTFYIYTHRSIVPTSFTDSSILLTAKRTESQSQLYNLRYWAHERYCSRIRNVLLELRTTHLSPLFHMFVYSGKHYRAWILGMIWTEYASHIAFVQLLHIRSALALLGLNWAYRVIVRQPTPVVSAKLTGFQFYW